jgi:hypothetical protein
MGKGALKIGDYVEWFESYADGIPGKDFGKGIVTNINNHIGQFSFEYVTFEVYRQKYEDFCWFEQRELRLLNSSERTTIYQEREVK